MIYVLNNKLLYGYLRTIRGHMYSRELLVSKDKHDSCVYVVRAKKYLYVGITNDPMRRFCKHLEDGKFSLFKDEVVTMSIILPFMKTTIAGRFEKIFQKSIRNFCKGAKNEFILLNKRGGIVSSYDTFTKEEQELLNELDSGRFDDILYNCFIPNNVFVITGEHYKDGAEIIYQNGTYHKHISYRLERTRLIKEKYKLA